MKILIVTDTWNNINGVSTTLKNTVRCLNNFGHETIVIEPSLFKTINAPLYPEVKLSLNLWKIAKLIKYHDPDAVHISTEGPLGIAAKLYCNYKKIPHTSSYHTKFPEYLNKLLKIPVKLTYSCLRYFHKSSKNVFVTSNSMKSELENNKFKNLIVWGRGIDKNLFCFSDSLPKNDTPVILCVSRASKEKGLDDFCNLSVTGKKILVGDGPYLDELKSKCNDVEFVGYKHGKDLVEYYQNSDVFVFPSKTDTFGLVMLESMSCGTPVAAYPVTGPIDVVEQGINGFMHDDLNHAVIEALKCDRQKTSQSTTKYNWEETTKVFLNNLTIIEKNYSSRLPNN
jgi:glycosyltransferase involved in cell wall biosynthesis